MAEDNFSWAQDQFSCSICLDLLNDPVTIPCGHSYCLSCITDFWNQDDQRRVYSCPQCRQTFTPRPALKRNVMFAEVVEKLKNTKVQTVRPALTGPGDVECDVCSGRKYKAVKSCLMCLESYCQTHFERHEEFHSGRQHKVTDATGRLQKMICPKHDKHLEIFCRADQCCICYMCMMDEHRNHETVATVVERTEKQKQLEETQRTFQLRIQEREKKIMELKETLENHREKTEVSRAEGLLKQLEQEIDDLRRRDAELKQLLQTDDHIHFLQSFQSLVSPLESSDRLNKISSFLSFDDEGKSVAQLKKQLEDLCKKEKKISDKDKATLLPPLRSQHSPHQPPPRIRSQYPLPPIPPSVQSKTPPPKSLRSQQSPPPLPPSQRSQQSPPSLPPSVQSKTRPIPPSKFLNSQQSPPPLPPLPSFLQSKTLPTPPPKSLQSQQSPPPLPPSQRSQQSPPSLPPSVQSKTRPIPPSKFLNSQQSPPPLPPLPSFLQSKTLPTPPPKSLQSQQSPPPLPPSHRSQQFPPPLPPSHRSQQFPPPLPHRSHR